MVGELRISHLRPGQTRNFGCAPAFACGSLPHWDIDSVSVVVLCDTDRDGMEDARES